MVTNNTNGHTTIIQQITVNNFFLSEQKQPELDNQQQEPSKDKPKEKKDKLLWYQFWFNCLKWLAKYFPVLAALIKDHPK
ncbi:hypothetical protein [Segetibacter aerophilus]|uniref:Uncharacterized protein n=1 Tax=Segetibacter aerophilus TaxID=670293 RepID=A0A512B914_9BACT|nr:hypothetical protein [Segetibacter aerophilus]GEO08317.1 hypothetical protein SAE01_08130 [Segetibacter aerophilus]